MHGSFSFESALASFLVFTGWERADTFMGEQSKILSIFNKRREK
jgi:hypothetical protein